MYNFPRQKALAVIWRVPENLPHLVTDYEKLQQIMKILIDNAIKFTESGTVTISAQLAEPREASFAKRIASAPRDTNDDIRNTLNEIRTTDDDIRETRSLEFTVQDTGVGIAEENLPFIFDAFKQGDSSTTRAHEGVGLGLYIVKKYSELLGGEVHVESAVSKGSTFTVALPIEQGA